MDLGLREDRAGSYVVVEVRGEVDMQTAPELRERLAGLVDGGQREVIVDLERLSFIDSTGLGALVAGRNHAHGADSTLKVVCAAGRVLRLFHITGLHEVFDIYPTLPEAVASHA